MNASRSPQLSEKVCALIASGHRLSEVARTPGMPGWIYLMSWLKEDADFRLRYDAARKQRELRLVVALSEVAPTLTKTGDELADEILHALRSCPRLSRSQITAAFGRTWARTRIAAALDTLTGKGLVRTIKERPGPGRPTEFFEIVIPAQ